MAVQARKYTFENGKVTDIADALDKSDMVWDAQKVELITMNGINVPSHQAVIRNDNNSIIGVVGKGYELIQNAEAFALMDVICQEYGASYQYLYEINGGRKVVVQAKMPDQMTIRQDDRMDQYINMATGFDGKTSVMAYFTTIRLFCENQLNASLRTAKNKVSIRHTKSAKSKMEEALRVFGVAEDYFSEFHKTIDVLSQKVVDRAMVKTFLNEVFGEADNTRKKNMHNEVTRLFKRGEGNYGKTAWDLYNGVTEYIDHHRGSNDEKRMASAIIGNGVTVKEKAFSTAVAL